MFLEVLEGSFAFRSPLKLFVPTQYIEEGDTFVSGLGHEAAKSSYSSGDNLDILVLLGRRNVYERLDLLRVGLHSTGSDNETEELPK